MKKVLFIALAIIASIQISFAQDEEVVIPDGWHTGGAAAFNFSQSAFINWAAGGTDNITGVATGNLFGNYKSGKHTWDNMLNLGYGLTRLKDNAFPTRKTDDLIDLYSKYGYALSDKWSAAALFNFRTQFTDGFGYGTLPADSLTGVAVPFEDRISALFAPAYISLGLGADYKPNDNFSLYISPLTARWVIVGDDQLSALGAYGVTPGENVLTEFGANLVAGYNTQLTETIAFATTLNLFYDYLGNVYAGEENDYSALNLIDVNWGAGITAQLWKAIAVSLNTQLIWDYNTRLTDGDTWDPATQTFTGSLDPKAQFREVLGVGLTYTFSNLK